MASDPAKQDLIRNAAIRVFARKGFHTTRAEEIAEEAGIAVGTIYNYFESKSQILLSIFEREFDEEVGLYESMAKSGVSVRERFSKILSAHFARLAESRDLAMVLVRERYNGSGEIGEAMAKMQRKMLDKIEKLIQDGVDAGMAARLQRAHGCAGVVRHRRVHRRDGDDLPRISTEGVPR